MIKSYYMAPLEGITTYTFRNAFFHHFNGFDKFFTPFIGNKKPGNRDKNEILPEHNQGMDLVPQILTGKANEFFSIAKFISNYGYKEVNLNLGCPSGTVFSRGRGSGALADLKKLDMLLDEIFEKSDLRISIKTRIGVESLSEWEDILKVFAKYPFSEVIIHPRLREEYYKGLPHKEMFVLAEEMLTTKLCYNGNIVDGNSVDNLLKTSPNVENLMIGRGILYNPMLIENLKSETDNNFTKEYLQRFKGFHDEILEGYLSIMDGNEPVLFKMKDLWTFFIQGFPSEINDESIKAIRRTNTISEYKVCINRLLHRCEDMV